MEHDESVEGNGELNFVMMSEILRVSLILRGRTNSVLGNCVGPKF